MRKIQENAYKLGALYAYGSLQPNKTDKTIGEIVLGILSYILPVLGGVALVMIAYGGILFITSSGDPDKLTKAKQTLLWAIIGIVIVALSWGIVVYLSEKIKTIL